jgi:signal transduction histidine kinase/CheY-like chemotaxis protein/HPt (histidine-containing phosphotransfer) domain-containing protein
VHRVEYCGDPAELASSDADERLRETNRLLAIAESLAHLGHWRMDLNGQTIARSPQASAIMGVDASEPLTIAAAFARVEPADRFCLLRHMVHAIRRSSEFECRAGLCDRDGRQQSILIRAQTVTRSDGSRLAIGVIRDISEQVASEAKLIAARDEARAATLAKSEFLATMSHEIRTPMTGVMGMIDLIATADDDQERAHYLAAMRHSAQMLMTVLDSILDFSKVEAGQIEIQCKRFDFVELARQTVLLFGNAGSAKGIAIELEADPGLSPAVRGDPVRLQQVMSNFISNAIKFTSRGRIVLSLAAGPGRKDHQRWRVAVRDTGDGISKPQLKRLFEPFVQVGDRLAGGTGLGLAISRRLVEAMGGKTSVRSKPGRGSTFAFEVELPVEMASTMASPAPVKASQASPARSLNVLVAEDNPINQMLIVAMVRRLGHQATAVGNGRLAVEAALAVPYDCILMDMQMPEMDGVQATRAIRANGSANAVVPIIALTADAAPERRRFYDNVGLSDFMTKPIDSDQLRQSLLSIAAAPRAPGPLAGPAHVIDPCQLDEIRRSVGNDKLHDLLEMVQEELVQRPPRMRLIAEREDFVALRDEAHGLKGAVASLGLVGVALAARAVELAGPGAELEHALDRLDGEAILARTAIAPLLCTVRPAAVGRR